MRSGIVTRESLSSIIMLIQEVFLPLMFVDFIYRGMTPELIAGHVAMLVLAAVFYPTVILVMRLVGKSLGPRWRSVGGVSHVVYIRQHGFIGLPLLAAVYPQTGVADLGMFVVVDQSLVVLLAGI